MRPIQVKQLDCDLTPTAGLARVGHFLKTPAPALANVDASSIERGQQVTLWLGTNTGRRRFSCVCTRSSLPRRPRHSANGPRRARVRRSASADCVQSRPPPPQHARIKGATAPVEQKAAPWQRKEAEMIADEAQDAASEPKPRQLSKPDSTQPTARPSGGLLLARFPSPAGAARCRNTSDPAVQQQSCVGQRSDLCVNGGLLCSQKPSVKAC
jgi:hypothetical protein